MSRTSFLLILVLPLLGCGGSSPSGPGAATPLPTSGATPAATLPAAPAGLTGLVSPGLGANAAVLGWSAVSNATAYIVEIGRASGGSDVSTTSDIGSTTTTVGGLPIGGTLFARVKARNQTGTGAASNEIRIESVDLRDAIDALYFGTGRLIPRDGATACVSSTRSWTTYPAGVGVRVIMSSTTVSAAAQDAVRRAAEDWAATTLGTNSVVVQLSGDADPRPGTNEITIATHPDPIGQGCTFDRGCTFLTIRSGVLAGARAIIGPSNSTNSGAYSHDAVGHGALGMCHIDGGLIGGARNTLMGGGPNVFACSAPSDVCIATTLSPLDAAAAKAVYASGLARGAPRSAFVAAGLVRAEGTATAAGGTVRRTRIDAETELVVIDH